MSRKDNKKEKKKRQAINRVDLEQAIAQAVKRDANCEQFAGVIVERVTPDEPGGINWALKGIRYGSADRALCETALSACVAEKALQFELSD